jgi:hypothetical protein
MAGLTTPLKYRGTGIHKFKYFEDLSASGGLKFEPVEAKRRSRSSGTKILDKKGRFEIGSKEIHTGLCRRVDEIR